MRQSQLFTKTVKNAAKDELSSNAQLLLQAGFISKLMAGVYSLLPLGWQVVQRIEQIIREELAVVNGQELVMPVLLPKEPWVKTGRWDSMTEILYKLQDSAKRDFVLGPTHEEIITPLVQQFLTSYKDLPVAVYQFQSKFRMELRPKSGILRGREFIMKDMYSFHKTVEDLECYYETMKQVYVKIFHRLGIGDVTYLTYASGGAFTQYSHEFQTVTAAGEDIIYLCNHCQLAVNREIKHETPVCVGCGQDDFTERKAIEVGNIFKLMDKFSQPFHFSVADETGKKIPILMGCYGIGVTRLLGTIVEVLHDERGMVWPEAIAPYVFHLVNLNKDCVQSDAIYTALQTAGYSVLYDDRLVSAGVKLNDADLLGMPYRLVVSSKTGNQIEYTARAGTAAGTITDLNDILHRHAR